MQQNFAASLALVLKSEGGFSNDAHDPGGATMEGITQRVYTAYRARQRLPAAPVRSISNADVQAIYRAQYWDAVHGDGLWAGLDYCLFDEGVNSGPIPSIKDLQAALGVKVDGQFGMVTMAALEKVVDRAALINRICDLRLNLLHRLTTWRFFGKGWGARVAAVRAASLKMIAKPAIKSVLPTTAVAFKLAA